MAVLRLFGMSSMVLLSIPLLIQIQVTYHLQKLYHQWAPLNVDQNEQFDFIVVGAGSAGSALTGRLVDEGYKVLLLEAGGPPHYLQFLPGMFGTFLTDATNRYAWPYKTTPQPHALNSYEDNQIHIKAGKSLGGSSMLNAMMYFRGTAKDYDEWAEMGNFGWSWNDLLTLFKKSEKLHGEDGGYDLEYHGNKGRLHVSVPPLDSHVQGADIMDAAASELGFTSGGSSMLNGMMYFRGTAKDYDEWEDLGNPGWSWKEILPFFKKSEKLHGDIQGFDPKFHGRDGRLYVSTIPIESHVKGMDLVDKAAIELGFTEGDYNGLAQDREVLIRTQFTHKHGLRADSYSSYIGNPRLDRGNNLKVLCFSEVSKVVLDSNKRATGVELERFGQKMTFSANKEVIISAGALSSPKILMLSGIGPRDHLKEMGVKVLHDLPGVGANLQDHLVVPYPMYSKNTKGLTINAFQALNPLEWLRYYLTRNGGPMGAGLCDTGLFIHSGAESTSDKYNRTDIQVINAGFGWNIDYGLNLVNEWWGHKKGFYDHVFRGKDNLEQYDMVQPSLILLRPKSRGSVKLKSNIPSDLPVINLNYLKEQEDADVLASGLGVIDKMIDTEVFKRHQMDHLVDTFNCGQHKPKTKAYRECFARAHGGTLWHFSGTCSMGQDPKGKGKDGIQAVVNEKLMVHGISGLRVVDASVMPRVVGGNTNAPTIMIGEKAFDMIHKKWNKKNKNQQKKAVKKDEL